MLEAEFVAVIGGKVVLKDARKRVRKIPLSRFSEEDRRHIELANGFADRIRGDDRFELVAPVPFSTVCFRAIPPVDDLPDGQASTGSGSLRADDWNRRLLEAVNGRGRVFLSHTELAGQFVLRLAVGSAHVRDEDLEAAWTELTGAYADLRTD